MSNGEDLLRTTFHERESQIDDDRDLLPGVRRRIAGHRRARRVTAVAGTAVAVAAIAVAGGIALGGGRPAATGSGASAEADRAAPKSLAGAAATAPHGWRLESSLGAQFTVPADWAVNDFRCGSVSTVIRGAGLESATACGPGPESPRRSVAAVMAVQAAAYSGPAGHGVTIDGVPAEREESQLEDGGYRGSIMVPSRNILVTVRTPQPAVGRRILDSLHLVTVDFNGCSVRRPTGRPGAARSTALAAPDPAAISICFYGDRWLHDQSPDVSLQASARLTGDPARALAAALNAARPGGNPDRPGEGCPAVRPVPDAVLLIQDRAGHVSSVFATFEGCVGRGLDDGTRRTTITKGIARRIAAAVHSNVGIDGDLPR